MKGFRAWCKVVNDEKKYFENYIDYAKKIKEIAEREVGGVKVMVFGSVVEGRATPKSDIDILIVSDRIPKDIRSRIRTKILKEIGLFSPFEIHIVNRKEFGWYKNFIKKYEIIE